MKSSLNSLTDLDQYAADLVAEGERPGQRLLASDLSGMQIGAADAAGPRPLVRAPGTLAGRGMGPRSASQFAMGGPSFVFLAVARFERLIKVGACGPAAPICIS